MSHLHVAHLLLGPLCLLGHQGGQLVLDLPLAHESQGPHEDLEAPPSQAPLKAPQALELPSTTERETREGKVEASLEEMMGWSMPQRQLPFFLLDNQSFSNFNTIKENTAADSFPRRKSRLFAENYP